MIYHPNMGTLCTYAEVAQILDLRPQSVRAFVHRGSLQAVTYLNKPYVTEGELLRYAVRVKNMDTGVLSERLRRVREGL